MDKKILLEKYIKKAIRQKLQEEEQAIKRAEKSLYLIYRFPKLKEAIEELMSPSFSRYLANATVIAPKPTTVRIELVNGLDFQLVWSSGTFIAKVSGKKYDLAMGSAANRASQAVANLLSLSPAMNEDASAAGGETPATPEAQPTADAGEEAFKDLTATPPAETPAPETPAPEEAAPPAEA